MGGLAIPIVSGGIQSPAFLFAKERLILPKNGGYRKNIHAHHQSAIAKSLDCWQV